jgi:hypothetical protein
MPGRGAKSLRDLRLLVEIGALVVATWLLLGWYFTYPISQADGTVFLAPYTRSQLAAGLDWTTHLYRIGVMGGSPMHEYAGTLPLVQLCHLVGMSTTATLNVHTIFLQVCFGFFGVKAMLALAHTWHGAPIRLHASERLVNTWLCSFAPLLGWRLGLGHENLVEGLLPFLVACALLWCARSDELSATALVVGWFAVWNGVSGFGAQLPIYSLIFGAPIAVVTLLDRRAWNRALGVACATLASALLVAVPRVAGMLAYASSGDAGRSLGDAVAYTFGAARWADWLGSLPWTANAATGPLRHDVNYPIGPLLCFAVLLWPRGRARHLAWAMTGGALLAVLFACDVPPVSTTLFALVPPLESFRIPARAILPILIWLPSVAMAACWVVRERVRAARPDEPSTLLWPWLGVAVACALIATKDVLPALVREPTAWVLALSLALLLRVRPVWLQRRALTSLVAPLAALGVLAFAERIPSGLPQDPIEEGPRALRGAVLAEAPELAMPLNRIIVVDAPAPYRMALAYAAGLSSIDGDFNPPRRFIELIGALQGRRLPSSTMVFELARSPAFPILQQLYNIRHALVFSAAGTSFVPAPSPPGSAWLPRELHVAATTQDIGRELRAHATALREHAWVLATDLVPPTYCDGRVIAVTTDSLGQTAQVEVDTTTACTLVVAMNYVGSLRATSGERTLRTFPIDIALTGVSVPPGRATISIGPVSRSPRWTAGAFALGIALLVAALAAHTLLRQPREQ